MAMNHDMAEQFARRIRNVLGEFNDDDKGVETLVRELSEYRRAHITQPAQAVDVGAIRDVIAWMEGNACGEVAGITAQIDKLTAALLTSPHGQGSAMNDALSKAVDVRVTVEPVAVNGSPDACQVWIRCGTQSFRVGDYFDSPEDGDWFAEKLRNALKIDATLRDNYTALVIRLGEVTARLEAADGLLREWLAGKWCTPEYDAARQRAYDHLKAADHV